MNEPEIFNDSFFSMEIHCDMVFTGIESETAKQLFQTIKSEVDYFDKILNKSNPQSEVSILNKTDKNIWLNVSDEFWSIITICYDFFQISNGAFEITVSPLIDLWKSKTIISEKQKKEALKRSGFDNVELDFDKQRIRFKTDGVEFDFGAIGKGYILDSLKPLLKQNNVENAIISFGGSSILAVGNHPSGEKWPIGISDLFNENEYIHLFSVCNETVSTSQTVSTEGGDEIKNSNRIISPATGLPVEEFKMVSVKSELAVLGEFISTTWLILPENDKEILSEQFKEIEILEVFYANKIDFQTKLTIL